MEQLGSEGGQDQAPAPIGLRQAHRRPFTPQFEAAIGQLYRRALEEPVPLRLLRVLRTAMGSAKG